MSVSLSIAGVADHLGVPLATVEEYATNGWMPLPDTHIEGGGVTIDGWFPDTVERWYSYWPTEYLSLAGLAEHLDIPHKILATYLENRKFPRPDARIGRIQGWLAATGEAWKARRPGSGARSAGAWWDLGNETVVYLSTPQIAERIGVHRGAMNHYKTNIPDARIGRFFGSLPQTVDDWQERRPGKRTPRDSEDWNLPPALQRTA
ncbi:hypothetical protein [Nocardia gipuzkoensis]|uniref:hypothetical protein n=1 Tax=Nocardia gipuzkoensis TaxID=2749991 RepID=UPI00237E84E2|nr:hypothetical protein [Nocardia gipuzkoensis]MDE1675137.1 hypothetical protein [Nocardia gipuzkoensis]